MVDIIGKVASKILLSLDKNPKTPTELAGEIFGEVNNLTRNKINRSLRILKRNFLVTKKEKNYTLYRKNADCLIKVIKRLK